MRDLAPQATNINHLQTALKTRYLAKCVLDAKWTPIRFSLCVGLLTDSRESTLSEAPIPKLLPSRMIYCLRGLLLLRSVGRERLWGAVWVIAIDVVIAIS